MIRALSVDCDVHVPPSPRYPRPIHCVRKQICVHYALYQKFIMRKGKRVSNALYTLCNKSLESNVTSRLVHVTKPRCQTLNFSPDYAK